MHSLPCYVAAVVMVPCFMQSSYKNCAGAWINTCYSYHVWSSTKTSDRCYQGPFLWSGVIHYEGIDYTRAISVRHRFLFVTLGVACLVQFYYRLRSGFDVQSFPWLLQLQLCDHDAIASVRCDPSYGGCVGSTNSNCYSDAFWSGTLINESSYQAFWLNAGLIRTGSRGTNEAYSVRCMQYTLFCLFFHPGFVLVY